jgi:hypothetical protein
MFSRKELEIISAALEDAMDNTSSNEAFEAYEMLWEKIESVLFEIEQKRKKND